MFSLRLFTLGVTVIAALTIAVCTPADAKFGQLTQVATSAGFITNGISPPGDDDRLFISQLGGRISIVDLTPGADNSSLQDFLLIPDVARNGPAGLLGLAFHPDYANNGKFYTYTNVANDNPSSPFDSVIREYTVSANDPDVADETPVEILRFEQPANLHQGGWIGFNPQLNPGDPQYLHIMSGDGGVQALAGDPNDVFGTVLRIDVDGDDFPGDPDRNYAIPGDNPFANGVGGAPEVVAWGLRNPYQASFDSETGDLYIGDVGPNLREEVNLLESGVLGVDFAWPRFQGTLPFQGGVAEPGDVDPLYEYAHGSGDLEGAAVTGGRVYRGDEAGENGRYFFADNAAERIWAFDPTDPAGTVERLDNQYRVEGAPLTSILSVGEDNSGNLYVLTTQRVYRLDSSAVYGDFNGDGAVDLLDLDILGTNFGANGVPQTQGDANGDGVVDLLDLDILGSEFDTQASAGAAVPEPVSAGVAAVCCLAGLATRRRR